MAKNIYAIELYSNLVFRRLKGALRVARLDLRREPPDGSGGIGDSPAAVAVALFRHRLALAAAGREGSREGGVDVREVDVDAGRGTPSDWPHITIVSSMRTSAWAIEPSSRRWRKGGSAPKTARTKPRNDSASATMREAATLV
ncbi:MAG TPA: hypothetical protein VM422_15715 [Amaricoccus sp.]|nr:hypothetical protein [Amaricoccus sp.]